jgi:hypothetical protein
MHSLSKSNVTVRVAGEVEHVYVWISAILHDTVWYTALLVAAP